MSVRASGKEVWVLDRCGCLGGGWTRERGGGQV